MYSALSGLCAILHSMNREPQFLLAAVRRFLHTETDLPVPSGLDWDALLQLASAHAVTPMLYTALQNVPIPDNAAAELRLGFESSARWSLALSAELAQVAGFLEAEGVGVIALKGPLLSQYLYGMLGARSSGDIDLLVKKEDVIRIRDILTARQYHVRDTLHWHTDSAYLRSRESEISFQGPSEVSIDLHWRLLPKYFASPFDELNVWESSRTAALAGRRVCTLASEHLFMLLCSHSAKHGFERLGWICDIARFLMVAANLDWTAVMSQARRTGTLRQVSLSARLAADLLGAPLPSQVPQDPKADRLARYVGDRFTRGIVPPTPPAELTRFCLGLLETPRHRMRYLAGHYLTPSEAEYKALRLPPPLFFLYYPFRPARLVVKHAHPRH
jgi:hypothetical protein